MPVPASEALVIATFVQAIMYGIYLVTLALSFRWLLYDDEGWDIRKRINWFMLSITALVFVLSTTDVVNTLITTICVILRQNRMLVNRIDIVNVRISNPIYPICSDTINLPS